MPTEEKPSKFLPCSACGKPAVKKAVRKTVLKRIGSTFADVLGGEDLCPKCKREKLASELTAAVPEGGSVSSRF